MTVVVIQMMYHAFILKAQVIVIMIVLWMSIERHNEGVTKGLFYNVHWISLNKFHVNIEAIFYVSLYMFTYISTIPDLEQNGVIH